MSDTDTTGPLVSVSFVNGGLAEVSEMHGHFFPQRESLELLIREILAEERYERDRYRHHDHDHDHHNHSINRAEQWRYQGILLGADVASAVIYTPPTDGNYQINLAGVVKVADAGANAAFAPVIGFTSVAAGAGTLTGVLNLTVVNSLLQVTTTRYLLASAPITIAALGGAPYGAAKYDLAASVLRL